MLAGIRDILLISTPYDLPLFKRLLGSGEQWGITLSYAIQPRPEGLAQAFLIGERFINNEPVCLVLGDNIFYGQGLPQILQSSAKLLENEGAIVFAYRVSNPERYGIIEFDSSFKVSSIIEKPQRPKSNYAVTGLYFYDSNVCELAKMVHPSSRGELEISALNNFYLSKNKLQCKILGRGMAWLDTGTPESLTDASSYFKAIEKRQGLKVSCPEEIAVHMGFLSNQVVQKSIAGRTGSYYEYVNKRLQELY